MQRMNAINNLYELYFIIVNNDTVIEVSQFFADMTEYTIDELINRNIADLLRCLRIGPNFDLENIDKEIEYFLFTKSLEVRFVNIEVRNNLGKTIYIFSEKPNSRLEEKLIFEEHIFLENTVNALIVSAPDLIVLKANQKFLDILDEPFNIKENTIGRKMSEIAPGFIGSEPEALWNTVIKTQKACYKNEGRFEEFARGVTYWDTAKIPVFENGKLKYIYETSVDVTERVINREKIQEQNELLKRQEKELKQHKEMLEANLESMTDCFYAINDNWEFTYINHAGEIAFDKSRFELLGKKVTDVFKADEITLENFNRTIGEKIPTNFEVISEALGNRWLEVSLYPSEEGLTCYFRDITSRKTADREIARLDRLNLVGQMAAGIGHEIRNPMTSVRGYLQLFGAKTQHADQKDVFDLMISELDRANSIITEFLTLAKTKPSKVEFKNLNNIIAKLYPLIEADAYNQNKQISFEQAELPSINIDENEISQMILNLVRNGLESMEENGTLEVKTYVEDNRVVLKVQDQGCGIPPEIIDNIGTPFFTTKDSGTGLGLATTYRIAESHNAKIEIDSNNKGTTFYVRFPIIGIR